MGKKGGIPSQVRYRYSRITKWNVLCGHQGIHECIPVELGHSVFWKCLFCCPKRKKGWMIVEQNQKTGTLYGVSVGPGDPELMTVKAVRILEKCAVWAAPAAKQERSVALEIARGGVSDEEKELLMLNFEMTADPDRLRRNHQEQAQVLRSVLEQGKDIAFVCLGDVSVYSTFEYVADILRAQGVPVESVPGVTSFCAVASALGRSLTTDMKKPLHIIPGAFEDMDAALAMPGAKVIMKSARRFPQVREKILASGKDAAAVVDCGMETEKRYTDLREMPETSGYFTTVLVGE